MFMFRPSLSGKSGFPPRRPTHPPPLYVRPLQAWELSGDAYSKNPGDKPWISEMYGYSYACAKADVWHVCHHSAMLYPGYDALGE